MQATVNLTDNERRALLFLRLSFYEGNPNVEPLHLSDHLGGYGRANAGRLLKELERQGLAVCGHSSWRSAKYPHYRITNAGRDLAATLVE